ncbi:MAG: phage tail protein [Candidatus Eremiobacteraeota bacterium]|nr:phage tail protein [Candidatus Eremiobacteraeota bacterium]
MSRIGGVVEAIVKSVDDPENLGRIQVRFPWLEDAIGYWARVAAPMAGKNRGCFLMPEVDDEVLVAFDHGDVAHPYVVGYCWSKPDTPPFSVDPHKRGIKSVSGHELIFDDNAGSSPTITLTTQGGFELLLDEGGGRVTLATASGVTLELNDAPPQAQVMLPTGDTITLDSTGLDVTVAGEVNVTALTATITAPAVTIDAAATSITGVLDVAGAVLSAGGVVSPTYTPGVGNLL